MEVDRVGRRVAAAAAAAAVAAREFGVAGVVAGPRWLERDG